ncbi:mechanosensitive ion channel family protein [Testudinibacter sp. TR-2022]|uniref:mechanosensitive ion channel family protein n=1 Tax=Testudinibacter sp. TR-2022 TaxID=2585029 RepID=UPI00111B2302|nr:mechanosensitive ion channel domain-containing protein [Testudinibacter sp. TR-2022]TNH08945.1 mechanosensitive ion channel [Pasteurellaceae bacterium Phil11]TNH23449.1 mechanosensitive ion channel [Testudinibacter sp. TR-2022]TNH28747.1 mechanosensitive ion channel [Testudinibacter sp. TR-2022]
MQTEQTLSLVEQTLATWQQKIIGFLPNLALSAAVLIVGHYLARLLQKITFKACNSVFSNNLRLAKMTATLVYWMILFATMILVLDILNLTNLLTHLLAGAGIIGIIAGFAFKDIASNAFAGLLIKSQQPFKTTHWVKIDDYLGEVQEVGMITTTLKTLGGKLAHVPNQLIYSGVFINYSALGKQRIVVSGGVSYGDELEKVKSVTLELVNQFEFVLDKAQTDFYFTDIGSSTYNFEVRFWIDFVNYTQYLAAKSEVIMQLKKRFEQEQISIAYNVMTLDFGVKGGVNLFDNRIQLQQENGAS